MVEIVDRVQSGKAKNLSLPQGLLDQADTQGYLLLDDILAFMPEVEENMVQLEEVLIYLSDRGLEIYSDLEEAKEALRQKAIRKEEVIPDKNNAFSLESIPADDTLNLYLRETACVPLLTFAQETALARQIEKGYEAAIALKKIAPNCKQAQILKNHIRKGNEAQEHLIKANTRLVISIAKKYMGQGVPLSDLIQEGNLGLIKAITKFDYHRGYKFSTYATWWIRQSITRALASQGRTIRIPVHMNDRLRKLHQISNQLEQTWGRKPTPEEIAAEMELKPSAVRWMLRTGQHSISLELPVGDEGDRELGDFIEDEETTPPTDTAYQEMLREELEEALSTLPVREARVIRLRFGLQNGRRYSLEEVGQKFGLTRERIRQLEKQALRRLRHPRRSRVLRGYLLG